MFSFFSRKQHPPEAVPLPPSPTASTSKPSPSSSKVVQNVQQLRTPSPSVDSASAAHAKVRSPSPSTKIARLSIDERQLSPTRRGSLPGPGPVPTATVPNPVFVPPEPTVESLVGHLSAIPAKTLHAYVLARVPRAETEAGVLDALAAFFAELAPPQKLHCVRCHKDFVEVENDDRSCLVPHDDESAAVERVGAAKRVPGTVGATFETLWECCGRVVEGDGDQGPPDGWCYEGKHTTDIKRARFRADSTAYDDKLVSCLRLNCHGIRAQMPRGARSMRKRPRSVNLKETSTDDEDQSEGGTDSGMDEIVGKTASAAGGRGRAKGKGKSKDKGKAKAPPVAADVDDGGDRMDVDDEQPVAESASVAGSARGARARPPKSKTKVQQGLTSAKRQVRIVHAAKVVPGTDGEDEEDDARSVRSAPASAKRRGRAPPKSKAVITDSDREMDERSPVKGKGKERASGGESRAPRSLSRTRAGEASETSVAVAAAVKPRSRAKKAREANAREREADGEGAEGADGDDEKRKKKRRKVGDT